MDKKRRIKWLGALQVGDRVAVNLALTGSKRYIIAHITEIASERAFKIDYRPMKEMTFDRDGNLTIGSLTIFDRYSPYLLEPVTRNTERKINRQDLIKKVRLINFGSLSKSQLESILELIAVSKTSKPLINKLNRADGAKKGVE